jgi:hypothetical protein
MKDNYVSGVLEFDMAGPCFQQFRREHKGFHGKGTFKPGPGKKDIDIPKEYKKHKTVSFYNKSRFFNWLPFVKTEEQIKEKHADESERLKVIDETDIKKIKLAALGDHANTTVLYSLHSDHRAFFTPQKVLGAKKIILTPFKHGVGLDQVNNSPVRQGGEDHKNPKHSASYTDARTGDVFRGSGLSSLSEGVYIVDEENTLVKLTGYTQAKQIIDKVLNKTWFQGSRHEVILEIVEAWFKLHNPEPANAPRPQA